MISGQHPFLPPENERSPVRRLRGRLTAPVTLWTALSTGPAGTQRAGLPISAVVVADGEPGHVLGLVDADTELWELIEESGRFAVSVLRWEHRDLPEVFAGLMPSPGGPFRTGTWRDTEWGPVPAGVSTWAGCRLLDAREIGWSLAVDGELEHVELGDDADPLLHRRGRYLTLS
ncbi:flavin reductase family protein [Flindersiella endophytica]